jgi:hypothetical protein
MIVAFTLSGSVLGGNFFHDRSGLKSERTITVRVEGATTPCT